jgi:hypothetical protein
MTVLVFALLGGLVGLSLSSDSGGFVFGAVLGALVGWVSDLAGRVRLLERRLDAARAAEARAPAETPGEPSRVAPAGATPTEPPRAPERPAASTAAVRARRAAAIAAERDEPSPFAALLTRVALWFTTGNVPVKMGVVLSVFGVGFLVKEGIDRQWLVLSLELRLLLVALFGIGLLVLGWRLRVRQRIYALSVQGGGVAVLYLTTYASYALYQLLPGAMAFVLLVLVTAGAGALAVLQDSRALAVLGIVGGFMAPVLTSSGSGDHVALFTYYAILNVAIVGIAWFKAWRVLNVLGFVFTFGIGTLWGYDAYRPELFATTEPFLVLFVLMYVLIPVLFATRQAPQLRGFVDGTLVFGTPIVAFGLQSQLVGDGEYGLALSAMVLAALYVGMATYLYRRRAPELRVLVEAQLALSVAFVTVAIPWRSMRVGRRQRGRCRAPRSSGRLGIRQQRRLALAAGVRCRRYRARPTSCSRVRLPHGRSSTACSWAPCCWRWQGFLGAALRPGARAARGGAGVAGRVRSAGRRAAARLGRGLVVLRRLCGSRAPGDYAFRVCRGVAVHSRHGMARHAGRRTLCLAEAQLGRCHALAARVARRVARAVVDHTSGAGSRLDCLADRGRGHARLPPGA